MEEVCSENSITALWMLFVELCVLSAFSRCGLTVITVQLISGVDSVYSDGKTVELSHFQRQMFVLTTEIKSVVHIYNI